MNSNIFNKQKNKLSMVTCYDYSSARILAQTNVDSLLIGDSLAMTMHGYKNTISANLEMMQMHTSAVSRGAENKFIISDLPFLSYRKSLSKNVSAVEVLMKAGAHAVKLECATGNTKLIKHVVDSGIPVMGHLGLTPQSIHTLGGYKIQGRSQKESDQLKTDAKKLQDAGCFAIVLECIPFMLAKEITELLLVPTIGIGAGPYTDGQVLVFQDLLGINCDFKPKFVKTYMNGHEQISQAINEFVKDVKSGDFPQRDYYYE